MNTNLKKVLLASTALVGFAASSAFAEMPAVSLTGTYKAELANVKQKKNFRTANKPTPNQKHNALNSEAKVALSAETKSEHGLVYGANVMLKSRTTDTTGFKSGKHDRSYLFVETGAGRVEVGSNYSVNKLLRVDASRVAKATGGASDGDWSNYVNKDIAVDATTGASSPFTNGVLLSGDNMLEVNERNAESANKVSFITPHYSGLQFGVSYTPDEANKGNAVVNTDTNKVKNLWSGTVAYNHAMGDYHLALSAGVNGGKSTDKQVHNFSSWNVGGMISTQGLSFAGSYNKDGKSLKDKVAKGWKDEFYTAGVGYEHGHMGVSLTYLHGKVGYTASDNANSGYNKTSAVSLGADYAVAKGLKPFVEVTTFELKPGSAFFARDTTSYGKNKGTVLMAGATVKF